jgi:hypothetical protein
MTAKTRTRTTRRRTIGSGSDPIKRRAENRAIDEGINRMNALLKAWFALTVKQQTLVLGIVERFAELNTKIERAPRPNA